MSELWTGAAIAIVGLAWIEWWVRKRGGVAWPERQRIAVSGGVAGLLTLFVAGRGLGLRYAEALLPRIAAAGLLLLLLVYLVQLLPRIRPLLGVSLPRSPSALFFWLPFVVYVAIMPWASSQRPPDGDEPFNLLVTHSLAYDFDAELTNNYAAKDSLAFMDRAVEPQKGDPRGPNGEMYSRHNIVLPAVLVPAYRVGGKYGALTMMCVFAAGLAWSTLKLARHFFADRPGEALSAYFILAFTSPLLLYSHQVWVEIPAALLLTLALDAVWSMDLDRAGRLRTWLPVLIPVVLLPLIKMRFVLVIGPLLLLLAWRLGRRSRRLVILALSGSLLLGLAILAFNYMQYGNLLKYHDLSRMSFYWNDFTRYPRGVAGLFFDSAFGLFATAPIWLLLIAPGRDKIRPVLQLLWIMAPYLLMLAPRSEWYGGWSPPFRYGCVALPLFALVLIPPLERRRNGGARFVLSALLTATALLTALWVARPGWTYNISDGGNHLTDALSRGLGLDIARFLPSAVRPNLALWLWPPVLVLAVALLWRWPRRHRAWVASLGAVLPLIGLATVSVAAHRLPTRVAQLEDPYIQHRGGSPWPEEWVVARTRFRGGRQLKSQDRLVIPVVPGGAYCSIELDYRTVGPHRPTVILGDALEPSLRTRLERNRKWSTAELGVIPWPADARELRLSIRLPPKASPEAAVLLDRLRLSWSDEPPSTETDDLSTPSAAQ